MPDPAIKDVLAYCFGGLGVLVEWKAYTLHCGMRFRRWSGLGAILWAAMYGALGAWTSCLTMGITAVRTWTSSERQKQRHLTALSFVMIFVGLTHISWQGVLSLLPAFAVINTTIALIYMNNRNMRIAMLGSSLAWIANDIYWSAWPALLAESIAAILNVGTIRKMVQPVK